jgi:hypothetical protein
MLFFKFYVMFVVVRWGVCLLPESDNMETINFDKLLLLLKVRFRL